MCPECYCLSAVEFMNNENVIFALFFFTTFPVLNSLLFLIAPFLLSAFHVTAVSRWTTPHTPNAKSGTDYLLILCWLWQLICVATSLASILISFHALVFSQPPGGIPGSQPLLPNSLDPTRPQGRTGIAVVVTGLSCDHFHYWLTC